MIVEAADYGDAEFVFWRVLPLLPPGEYASPSTVAVVTLLPATPEEVGRCLRQAERIGANRLLLLSLFAQRVESETDLLYRIRLAPDSDEHVSEWETRMRGKIAEAVDAGCPIRVYAAWGATPTAPILTSLRFERIQRLNRIVDDADLPIFALGETSTGEPASPLDAPDREPSMFAWRPKRLAF